jgi:hypothetical protein
MIASSVGVLAGGDAVRDRKPRCVRVGRAVLISWLFKLSILVRLVSDSILVGFKAGAGLTIIVS